MARVIRLGKEWVLIEGGEVMEEITITFGLLNN